MNEENKPLEELADEDLFFIDDEDEFGLEDFPQIPDGEDELVDIEDWVDPYENMTDPEDLDRVYYDTWAPRYDFCRPIRVSGVQYFLQATPEEIEGLIAEMKRTNSSELVIVPYYEDGKLEHNFYEGLLLKEFCTRHLLDNDYQYGSEKWNYYDGVFHFAVFSDEMDHIASFFHYRLGTEMPQEFKDEITAKNAWYDEKSRNYENYNLMEDAYREWTLKWMEEHRKGKPVLQSPAQRTKLTGIRFCIDADKDKIESLIEEMKRTRYAEIVIVPNTDGTLCLSDEGGQFYYEALILKEYAERWLSNNPYFENYNASKDGEFWYARIYYSDTIRKEFYDLLGVPYCIPDRVKWDVEKKDEELRNM